MSALPCKFRVRQRRAGTPAKTIPGDRNQLENTPEYAAAGGGTADPIKGAAGPVNMPRERWSPTQPWLRLKR